MLIGDDSNSLKNYLSFDQCIEAILLFDKDGVVTYRNEEAKRELGANMQISNNCVSYIFPKVFERDNNELKILDQDFIRSEGDSTYYETFAYRNNQTCYPVRLKVVIPSAKKECGGICFAINISEEKQAKKREKQTKEELTKAINVKNEFLANITHELRTPVNGIRGLADNLLDTELSPMQLEEVKIIIRSCNNMAKMVNELLDFSKITAGKLVLERREFNFKEFMHHTLSSHIPRVQEKGLKLILNMGANIPTTVIGDELRLGQIINNLLSNAVKFTTIGQITIEIMNTYQTDEEIELFFLIVDSGIGISMEEMDKLFISFSQVDGSITRRFGGTGLGLVISKRLVELMGGSIHVDSVKGKGSAFSFSIRFGVKQSQSEPLGMLSEVDQYLVGEGGRFFQIGHINCEMHKNRANSSSFTKEEGNEREDRLRIARETLEKLMICIELGNWEKAENFAGIIKNLFLEAEQEGRKKAFRLELAIRKEDYDSTIVRIKELQDLLS